MMWSVGKRALPALWGALGLLLLWQLAVTLLHVHPVTLPPPTRVLATAWELRGTLGGAFLATAASSLLGLLSSVCVGCLVAILFSQSRWLRTAFYPYVVFLQTVPIVAIAPLLITWFGYGFKTVVMVAMIISLFPVVSNMTTGLISVDDNLRDLFRLNGATRWQILVKLRLPNAVGQLLLGMRISAGLAVIGAIVGEFFVGGVATGYPGLGTVITGWQNQTKTDAVLAAVGVSTLLGLCVLGLVNAVARVFLSRWMLADSFENET